MKQLKMLSLGAIAALGLMACVGVSTSAATTLATDSAGTTKYTAGTELHATMKPGTSATLKDTSGNTTATCTESTVKGTLETATGTWAVGSLTAQTLGGCSQTTDPVSPGTLEVMQSSGDAGTVAGKHSKMTIEYFGVSCVYGTGEGTTLGTITGGEASEFVISAPISKTSGGFLCPSTTTFTATYVITSPHALHIIS